MADTVQDLVTAVIEEGSFDVSEPTVLRWLSRRQRDMLVRARAYRKRGFFANTEPGRAEYPLPLDAAEVLELQVGGEIWPRGRHSDLANGALGRIWLSGPGGLAIPDEVEGGVSSISLYPTPEGAVPLSAYWVAVPPDLEIGVELSLKVPPEYTDALILGAVATGLLRTEGRPDAASPLEEIFQKAVGELRRRTNRALRGSGVAQVRVLGINA